MEEVQAADPSPVRLAFRTAYLGDRFYGSQVQAGERVEKGQIIGRTGDTGLAGGDHLHFGVCVSGIPVNPVEWWDAAWIKNNISGKLSGE